MAETVRNAFKQSPAGRHLAVNIGVHSKTSWGRTVEGVTYLACSPKPGGFELPSSISLGSRLVEGSSGPWQCGGRAAGARPGRGILNKNPPQREWGSSHKHFRKREISCPCGSEKLGSQPPGDRARHRSPGSVRQPQIAPGGRECGCRSVNRARTRSQFREAPHRRLPIKLTGGTEAWPNCRRRNPL